MNEKAPSIASAVGAIGPLEEARRRLRRGNLAVELLRGGTKAALRADEIQLSHDELRDRVGRVAGGLAANGVREGDRVAIYASNSLDWAVACLGLYWLGAVVVAINPAYKSAEAEHIFGDSDPRVVISDQAHMPIVMRLGRLITYAREQLADFKCPRAVRFTASLPRNAMGKVQRDRLAPH